MFLEKIHVVDFRLPMFLKNVLMKNLCSYVLALATIFYRAKARHFAGQRPAPHLLRFNIWTRVLESTRYVGVVKLQFIEPLPLTSSTVGG